MKVIKKPDVSNWFYQYDCINCDSELEVESKDLKYSHYDGDQREPGYETYSCNCAVCNQSHTVPITKIPKLVQLEVKARIRPTAGSGGYFDR